MVELNTLSNYVLKRNTLTLTKCWTIRRKDGKIYNFTEHDLPIYLDDVLFTPSMSVDSTAIEQKTGFESNNLELQGFVGTDQITHEELLAGELDKAQVFRYIVDWKYPFNGYLMKTKFTIGSLTYNQLYWKAELQDYTYLLKNPIGRTCNRLCPYVLGNEQCGVSLLSYTSGIFTITDVTTGDFNTRRRFKISSSFSNNKYNLGTITFTSGKNLGKKYEVSVNTGNDITLYLQTNYDINVGDTAYLTQGCDRNYTTCRDVFNNILRFGGFPFVIGKNKAFSRPDIKVAGD